MILKKGEESQEQVKDKHNFFCVLIMRCRFRRTGSEKSGNERKRNNNDN